MVSFVKQARANPFLSCTAISSLFGLLLSFIGMCMAQSFANQQAGIVSTLARPDKAAAAAGSTPAMNESFTTFNSLGLFWYYLVFFFFVSLSILGSIKMGGLDKDKHILLCFLAVCLSYLPSWVNEFLAYSPVSQYYTSASLTIAGLVLYVLTLICLIVLIGLHEPAPTPKQIASSARNSRLIAKSQETLNIA